MTKDELLDAIQKIMKKTDELTDSDRIKLRRCCGHVLDDVSTSALMIYYRVLQNENLKDVYGADAAIFPAVCTRCVWSSEVYSSSKKKITVAAAARELAKKEDSSDRLQKKLVRILDYLHSEDGMVTEGLYRLIHQVHIKEPDIVIDTVQLAYDLVYWNHSERFVQKKWIQEFYADNEIEEE